MPKIKNIVVRYLRITAVVLSLLIIIMTVIVQFIRENQLARSSTRNMFQQIEQLFEENSKETEETRDEFSDECLKNAETIAYIIQNTPSVVYNLEELRKIAKFTNVDEIHLFNTDGIIFAGTHPEYYNMSVNDGEQIGFFKKMLSDKTMKLVQPLTPNTAIGKLIQYSAVWSPNGEFFVQVGMEQENVMKVTEKNEMRYIFSLLRVNSSVNLYAVNKENGRIIGCTNEKFTGEDLDDIGISLNKAISQPDGFYANVNGVVSFCMFADCGDSFVGRTVTIEDMYGGIAVVTIAFAVGIILVIVIMVWTVSRFINREVIKGVNNINEKLEQISGGNLDERVNVGSCLEFTELSNHINEMIDSLLSSTDKISDVLDKANLQIGVYEYNEKMKSVRFTKKVSKILGFNDNDSEKLSQDCALFKDYLRARIFDEVDTSENIYRLYGDTENYIKYEEFTSNNSILGVVMDVTADYQRRKQLEIERDMDLLTGLLNRRGLDSRLSALFKRPEKLGFGALVMIDADGLKKINDTYGHESGDAYLKSIAKVLSSFGSKNCICARLGGDEFVMFLHNLENEKQVEDYLEKLSKVQGEGKAEVAEGQIVPIEFSFGTEMLNGTSDYSALLKSADEKMYSNKRSRKKART